MKLMKMVIKRGYSTRNYPRKYLSFENRILFIDRKKNNKKKFGVVGPSTKIIESENLQFTITIRIISIADILTWKRFRDISEGESRSRSRGI